MSASSHRTTAHSRWRKPTLVLIVLLVVALGVALLRPRTMPQIAIEADRPGVGPDPTQVKITLTEGSRGLAGVRVEAVQNENAVQLATRDHRPRGLLRFWGPREMTDVIAVAVGRDTVPGLTPGDLEIRVTAERVGPLLRSTPPEVATLSLPVRLKPPSLAVTSQQHIVAQGGSGVVVYRVAETALEEGGRDGVEAGDWFFPGQPLAEGPTGARVAFFAMPYDLDHAASVRLVAEDALGNRSTRTFIDSFLARPLTTDTIEISDRFLERVVPAILAETPELEPTGALLQDYLQINGDLRRANNETLAALAASSRPTILWSGAFRQLPSSRVTSRFADRRTYRYEGKDVDQQDHLGYDLASVRRAPVPAANAGVVVLARYFGIYGNTVVVDHGCGLMSLYSHLSALDVETGQLVAQGETLGRTGETGLAGGDHLHFTLLIGGLAVDPLEWWDGKWIRDRVMAKLAP